MVQARMKAEFHRMQEYYSGDSKQHVKTQIQMFSAARLGAVLGQLLRDTSIACFVHWRAVTHIRKTARWHMFLKDDAMSYMSTRHSAWCRFVAVSVSQLNFNVRLAGLLTWRAAVLDVKAIRVMDAASSESLGRVLRQAVQKSGVETVRQVLLRWVNSIEYAKSQR